MTTDSLDSPQGRTHSMHLRATESSPEKAGSRTLRFIASDETPDRVGDIIQVSGWNLSSYKKNPVVLWGHDAGVPPIGRATNVRRGKKPNGDPALFANIEFAPEEAHPFAETVYQLAKRGYLNAVSVGFMPKETKELTEKEKTRLGMEPYGQMYSKADLLEISVVSIPANPSALVDATRSLVTEGVVGEKQVNLFLEHVAEDAERRDLSERLKSNIRGFIDLDATEKSPACRQDGETEEECVERKIPELVEEGMEQDQAVAAASSMCEDACGEKDAPPLKTKDVDKLREAVSYMEQAIKVIEAAIMEYSGDDKAVSPYDDDEDKPKREDADFGALVEAQTEQARAMTTLTDTISDLTKRLDMAVGGARGGAIAPEASTPEPVQPMSEAEIEDIVRSATTDLLERLQHKER